MAELADAADLKSAELAHVGSSPTAPTTSNLSICSFLSGGFHDVFLWVSRYFSDSRCSVRLSSQAFELPITRTDVHKIFLFRVDDVRKLENLESCFV